METLARPPFVFMTWVIILLEVAIRKWVINGQQKDSGRLWRLSNAQLVLRGVYIIEIKPVNLDVTSVLLFRETFPS